MKRGKCNRAQYRTIDGLSILPVTNSALQVVSLTFKELEMKLELEMTQRKVVNIKFLFLFKN